MRPSSVISRPGTAMNAARSRRALRVLGEASTSQISEWAHPRGGSRRRTDYTRRVLDRIAVNAHPVGGGADRPADVLASETIAPMHLSGMRTAPEFARGQLAAGISVERTANAENNETGRRHDGIMALFACICGVRKIARRRFHSETERAQPAPMVSAPGEAQTRSRHASFRPARHHRA
jgi:hypothetical protein